MAWLRQRWRGWAIGPAIALTYFLLAALAISSSRLSGGVALLWIANAPLIALLCRLPRRRWRRAVPAAVLGSFAATYFVSPVWFAAPFFAFACVGEGVLAAVLMRRWNVADSFSDSPRSIARFVLAAGIVAPASFGILGMLLGMWLFGKTPAHAFLDWFVGHSVGTLIGAPLALLLLRPRERGRPHWRNASNMAALALVGGITALVFGQHGLPLLFLPLLPVLIATFTAGRLGAAASIVIVAVIGGGLTVAGHGPVMLISADAAFRMQFFQFYLAVLFLGALPVAATLAQRDRLLAALGESEARYRLLADHASDVLLELDPDGTIRFASPAIRELGGLDPEGLVGRNALDLVFEPDRDRVQATHRAALEQPETTHAVEYRFAKSGGGVRWFETNTRAVRGPDGSIGAVVSIIRDLSGRKSREDELIRAATTDPLTGLLNRAAFRRSMTEAMAASRRGDPSTLALLDLDHFKSVNDRFGHAVGDAALLTLADLLRDCCRAVDVIGRVGGEEFAIVLRGLPIAEAAPVCDRLRRNLAGRPITSGTEKFTVTMSMGLAQLCPGFTLDAIYAAADTALYRAKAKGRDRVEEASDLLAM